MPGTNRRVKNKMGTYLGEIGNAKTYRVEAHWDPVAHVWMSKSNLPGPVIETATLDEFEALIRELSPELLTEAADIEWTARRHISLG